MLQEILNKSWKQHPAKQQQYGHLPPIATTIKIRRTRPAEYCWRSWDKLTSYVLLWTHSHGPAKEGWQSRTYIQQLCVDMGCSPEDLPEKMDDREGWWERVRDIRADGVIWWWWWYYNIYIGINRQTVIISQFFNVVWHTTCSKLRSKHEWRLRQPEILPDSHEETQCI